MQLKGNCMQTPQELYQIADELRAIASNGLRNAEIGYDKERYEMVLKASARLIAALESTSFENVYAQYTVGLPHLSPILCVEAAVFREGKILLIQRRDDRMWALPGGVAEVGESLAQAAERELWEEAGVHGKAAQLLGVFDSRIWHARTRLQLCSALFRIDTEETPVVHSMPAGDSSPFSETLGVGFFAEEYLPELSVGHDLRVPFAFKLLHGEFPLPFFDR